MGSRYLITGVQLGMLQEAPEDERRKMVQDILEKQYISSSNNHILEDIILIQRSENVELPDKLQDVPKVLFFQKGK